MTALALLLSAAPALAQDANDRDPSSNAPGGDAYDIPLDSGRDDAAPSSSSRRPRSRVHSDQGLGSSTQVPGATTTTPSAPRPAATKPAAKRHKRTARKPATITTPRTQRAPRAQSSLASAGTGGDGPSSALSLGLLALAAIVAAALAVLGRRAR